MLSIVLSIVLSIFYIFYVHPKLMDNLGFSERDEKLMFIGLFFSAFFGHIVSFIIALIAGKFLLSSLIGAALFFALIYFNYKRL